MFRRMAPLLAIPILVAACGSDGEDSSPPAIAATAEGAGTTPPEGRSARLVRVLDGDSIEVEMSGTTAEVRLVGINAPERDECHGDAARHALGKLLEDEPLTLVKAGDDDTDRFGRLLRYVYAATLPVAEAMLASGHVNVLQGDYNREDSFVALADEAATAKLGMWRPDACGPQVASVARISTVEYDPSGPDRDNATEEYVEIRNDGTSPIDLTDWTIRDESSHHRYRFRPLTLAPGASLRLRSGCGDDGPEDLYWCAGDAVWSNGGDTVLLQDPHGNVVDRYLYRGNY
jgi:endonuclease YncB( thermonuclease family)